MINERERNRARVVGSLKKPAIDRANMGAGRDRRRRRKLVTVIGRLMYERKGKARGGSSWGCRTGQGNRELGEPKSRRKRGGKKTSARPCI